MGDRRISDLTAQTSFASGDCLAVDNSGNTESKKITAANAITTPINNVSQKVSGSTDAYSSSKAYSVGDLVIYNNTVYECTTACSAASWSVNQSNFTATTLSSKLTSLNQALSTYTITATTKYSDIASLVSNSFSHGVIPYVTRLKTGTTLYAPIAFDNNTEMRFNSNGADSFQKIIVGASNTSDIYYQSSGASQTQNMSLSTYKLHYRA